MTAGRGETPDGDEMVWRWEVRDRRDEIQVFGPLACWGDPAAQCEAAARWARDRMALLMYDVEPEWERLAGWRVRVWSPHGDVSEHADDWLAVVKAGSLADKRARAAHFAPPVPLRG